MKRSNRLVLLIGALLAVVAFVGIVLLLGQPSGGGGGSQPTPPTTVHVVKAKVAIPAGTIVTQDMLDATGELPIGAAQNAFQDPGLVISKTIRKDAQPGTILTFDTMAPVTGPYVGATNPIRGVPGGGLPWMIDGGRGSLDRDGRLSRQAAVPIE